MATIEQFIQDIERRKRAFARGIEDSTLIAINDSIATIQERVQERGTNAKNAKFKPYTEKYKKFKKGGTYITRTDPPQKKKRPNREGNGLVNLTYTGEMFRSIGIIAKKNQGGVYTAVIGGRDKETQAKINGNSKLRPFLELSEREVSEIQKDWGNRVVEGQKLIFK